LFRNQGKNIFREIGVLSGEVFKQRIVARGIACSDFDLDGDVDALVSVTGGRPLLLQNNGGNRQNAIRLILRGTKSNRSAYWRDCESEAGQQWPAPHGA
jgi:hypothetical protein